MTLFYVTIMVVAIAAMVLGCKLIDSITEIKKIKIEDSKKELEMEKSEPGTYYRQLNEETGHYEEKKVDKIEKPGIYRKYNEKGNVTGKVFKWK